MLNSVIQRFFGVILALFMFLGILFPDLAWRMIPLSIVLFIFLMFINGLHCDFTILKSMKSRWPSVIAALVFGWVFQPLFVFLLSRFFSIDPYLQYGLFCAVLTPAAIVAPFFAGMIDADETLTFLIVTVSMFICPLVIPVGLYLLGDDVSILPITLLIKTILLLIPLPVLLSFLCKKYLSGIDLALRKSSAVFNLLGLGLLMFTLFGVSFRQFHLDFVTFGSLASVFLILLVHNLVPLIVVPAFLNGTFERSSLNAIKISLTTKNVAVGAGLLLLLEPRSALAPSIGLLANALIFNIIPFAKRCLR